MSPFLHKQVGGCRHFGFIQNASSLVFPSFGDVGKLQKLQNFDMHAADIRRTF